MWTNKKQRLKCRAKLIAANKHSHMAEECDIMRFCEIENKILDCTDGYKFSDDEFTVSIIGNVMYAIKDFADYVLREIKDENERRFRNYFLGYYCWGFAKTGDGDGEPTYVGKIINDAIFDYRDTDRIIMATVLENGLSVDLLSKYPADDVPENIRKECLTIKKFIESHPFSFYEYYYRAY